MRPRFQPRRWVNRPLACLLAMGLMGAASGVKCDQDAQASFRQAAVGPVGDGVKTILNGLIDGAVAAIRDAGDGPSGTGN